MCDGAYVGKQCCGTWYFGYDLSQKQSNICVLEKETLGFESITQDKRDLGIIFVACDFAIKIALNISKLGMIAAFYYTF